MFGDSSKRATHELNNPLLWHCRVLELGWGPGAPLQGNKALSKGLLARRDPVGLEDRGSFPEHAGTPLAPPTFEAPWTRSFDLFGLCGPTWDPT